MNFYVRCPQHPTGNVKYVAIRNYLAKIEGINGYYVDQYYGLVDGRVYHWVHRGNLTEGVPVLTVDEAYDLLFPTPVPKDWVVSGNMYKQDPTWFEFIRNINQKHGSTFNGLSGSHYGIMDGLPYCGGAKNATVVTLEEAIKILTGKTQSMKTIPISQEFLAKAYAAADSSTKELIKQNVDAFELTTTEEFVKQMKEKYKGCPEWSANLKAEFPQQEEIDLSIGTLDNKDLFRQNGMKSNAVIAVRNGGSYANKSFYLNSDYEWEIQQDSVGDHKILIPKRKS